MNIRTRSFIIMFSRGLTQLTTVILSIILVRMVSQQIFGMYRQVYLVYIVLAAAFSLQLDSSLYYFVPKLPLDKRRALITQTFLITMGLASVIALIMFAGAELISQKFNNPGLAPLIKIFALYPFVERLMVLIPAFMISIDRPVRAGFYTLAAFSGRIAAVVITFMLGYGLTEVMWVVVCTGAVVSAAGCFDVLRFCEIGKWQLEKDLITEQFHYTWPLLAGMVVATLNLQLDKVLISVFLGTESYAVYSCGAMQLPVVGLVTVSLSYAMMPDLVVMLEKGNLEKAIWTWQEGARKCSLVIFPCFVFFLVTGFDFMVFLYGKDYSQASWPFRIYLLALPVKVAIYATLFRAAGKTAPIAKGAIIALVVNAVVSITLVILGKNGTLTFIGPAIGTVTATWCSWLYLLSRIRSTMSVTIGQVMRWKELAGILFACVICGAILCIVPLPKMPLVIKLIVQAIIYSVIFLAIVLSTGLLNKDEKQLLILPVSLIKKWCFPSKSI
ncbi:MAG: oligosaccharide flippase family protein [Sedimentisphaerales bacterium]|nr:oligosaccharide flippase family protein [Sedimentisphaerales bacterium]